MKRKKILMNKVKPLFTKIITTAETFKEVDAVTDAGLIDPKMVGTIKGIQKVISVGSSVRFVQPGDLVSLNFNRYAVQRHRRINSIEEDINEEKYKNHLSYQIPLVTINGENCLFIDEGDVELIIEEFEEQEIEVNLSGIETIDTSIKSPLILP